MSVTLITTPGAADANSYATVDEADAYNGGRPFGASWDAVEDKAAALAWAAQVLDGLFVWTGMATYEVQLRSWPRKGMFNRNGFPIPESLIPLELKYAQAELARQIALTDLTADDDVRKKGITSISAGPVSLGFAGPDHTRDKFGIWPDVSWLTVAPDAVQILLVPSWYVRPETQQGIIFEEL